MKKSLLFLSALFLASCGEGKKKEEKNISENTIEYAVFGDTITIENAKDAEKVLAQYKNLKENDTIALKFTSVINDVCQKKGCWMSLNLPEDNEVFVKFKDYEFFVPKNAQERKAVVNGKAFVSVTTVNELRHYAKDEGKTEEEINAITEPEITYGFMADGVLIEK